MSKSKKVFFNSKDEENSFAEWNKANVKKIQRWEKLSTDELVLRLCLSEWRYLQASQGWTEAMQLVKRYRVFIPEAEKAAEKAIMKSFLYVHWNKLKIHLPGGAMEAGRVGGALSQKKHAAQSNNEILSINNDLLKNPSSARWTIRERAEYIYSLCKKNGVTQPNKKPYAISTIEKKITGK